MLSLSYDFQLGVANNGNVAAIVNNVNPERSQSFTYDSLNRLATAESQAGSGTHCWGLEYGYDIWANLLSASVTKCSAPSLSLAVNANNRITTSGYAYDAAGNMTTVAGISGSLVYNAENQMTSGAGVTHSYDGDGRRVKKSNGTLYWYGPEASGGGEVLQETNLTGGLLDEYVFFNGSRTARRNSSGLVGYYFTDHLGSSRVMVVPELSTTCYEADFYPFGGERVITNTCSQNYKFTGKERDAESGLDYFGIRSYSSSLGRFVSPDSIANDWELANPQTWNRYTYARNNPLIYIDPNGAEVELIGTEKEREKAFQLLKESVGEEAAAQLTVRTEGEGDSTRYFVDITGD